MKILFLIVLLLLISLADNATNYYVDSSVADTNIASATPDFTRYNPVTFSTSTGSASVFKTLADLNAKTFAPGDFVYFKRGDSWFGQLNCDSGTSNGTTGVYCMGDSQTSADYPPLLATSLGSGYSVADTGVGGENTAQMLARFIPDVTSQTKDNYVIIMGGTNDIFQGVSTETIKANLQAIYNAAKAEGSIVIALTITPAGFRGAKKTTQTEINSWIMAKPANVDFVVDTYAALDNPANPNNLITAYSLDGTHYTSAGNSKVLSAIHRAVTFFRKPNPNVITYGAYGTGANPILHHAVDCSSSSNWTQESTNKWKYSVTLSNDAGNMIYNNSSSCGVKKWNKYQMNQQGYFYWDKTTHYLYIYSTANPGLFYSKIEVPLNLFGVVRIVDTDYVTVENITVTKGGRLGVNGARCTNVTIRNCDVSWIGAGCQLASDSIRVGNGIQFWSASTDILVENCRIWECYDAGISNQSYDDFTTFRNIVYRNNLIWNCEYSFEIYSRKPNSIVANTVVENNTCVNAGTCWGHAQRHNPSGYHLRLALTPVATTNFVIKINIFDTATKAIIGCIYNDAVRYWSDYNCFYQPTGNMAFKYGTIWATFSSFKSAFGWDEHSLNTSPLFANKSNLDYRLSASSACIDSGSSFGDMGKLNFRNFK